MKYVIGDPKPQVVWELKYDQDFNVVLYANGIDVAYLDDSIHLLPFEDGEERPDNIVFNNNSIKVFK